MNKMHYFFTKKFNEQKIANVDYYKYENCGFCAAKTLYEIDKEEWGEINRYYHEKHSDGNSIYNSSQRWFNQALMLYLLQKHCIIPNDNWLDYASGAGHLPIQLEKQFNLSLHNYDKYMKPLINSTDLVTNKKYDLVLNGAFLEHIRCREDLDTLNQLVTENGVLAIHTLVRENIPKDPEWFYLLPVHTSFHTNKSMQILMDQWGYTCSIYNEYSQLWIFFKDDPKCIENKVNEFNTLIGWDYLKFKIGFMDYWNANSNNK